MVRSVSELTSADLPLRQLFAQLALTLAGYFGASIVIVATAGDAGIHVEYALEDGSERPPDDLTFEPDAVTSAVIGTFAPILYRRADEWSPGITAMTARHSAIESALFVPILFVGRCIGVLSLQSPERDAFDARDAHLLEACALYVGAWLYSQRGREEALAGSRA